MNHQELKEWLDSEEFYNYMQHYRHAKDIGSDANDAFEVVKKSILCAVSSHDTPTTIPSQRDLVFAKAIDEQIVKNIDAALSVGISEAIDGMYHIVNLSTNSVKVIGIYVEPHCIPYLKKYYSKKGWNDISVHHFLSEDDNKAYLLT